MIKEILKEWLNIIIENDFDDVNAQCLNPKEVVEYLNKVRANAYKDYPEREKFSKTLPFVHAKSSFFMKDKRAVNVEYFKKQMTTPPKSIINTNEKILKTGRPNEFVYKTGIPAFSGIIFDKKENAFKYIRTCPGAGTCVSICYALKGRYIQYPNSYDSMTRRLNLLWNHPDLYEEQMYNELKQKCKMHKAIEGYKPKVIIRWNDSGDFFSKKYVKIAENVIAKLKKEGYNINSYAYTKVANIAKNNKFGSVSFSAGAKKSEMSKIDPKKQKMSMIVPTELFKGLDLLKISDLTLLKSKVSEFFGLNKKDVITYDELMMTSPSGKPKWHVIVTPDDGDDAATRNDVKTILLTQH